MQTGQIDVKEINRDEKKNEFYPFQVRIKLNFDHFLSKYFNDRLLLSNAMMLRHSYLTLLLLSLMT